MNDIFKTLDDFHARIESWVRDAKPAEKKKEIKNDNVPKL